MRLIAVNQNRMYLLTDGWKPSQEIKAGTPLKIAGAKREFAVAMPATASVDGVANLYIRGSVKVSDFVKEGAEIAT